MYICNQNKPMYYDPPIRDKPHARLITSVKLEAPVLLYRDNMPLHTKTVKLNDGVRLIGGMLSEDTGEPTHTVQRIGVSRFNFVKLAVSNGQTIEHLRFDTMTRCYWSSKQVTDTARRDFQKLTMHLVDLTEIHDRCARAYIKLPAVFYEYLRELHEKISQRKTQMNLHHEYFRKINSPYEQ